jgi:hypothetical protein
MSWTLTVAFPARVLRWGYLSQGKGGAYLENSNPYSSLSIRKTIEDLELHVVSRHHGLPRPTSTPAPLGEGLQDQLLSTPMRGYMSACFLSVSESFAKIGEMHASMELHHDADANFVMSIRGRKGKKPCLALARALTPMVPPSHSLLGSGVVASSTSQM